MPADTRFTQPGNEWLKEEILSDEGKQQIDMARKLSKVAQEAGLDMTHMALAWCARNPNVSTVILGASRIEQLRHNFKALDAIGKMTDDVMKKIDVALK